MIIAESVVLTPGVRLSRRFGSVDVGFLAIPNDRQLPFDLSLRAFGRDQLYVGFAQCAVGEKTASLVGEVKIAFQGEGQECVAIVGLDRVLFVDIPAASVREVLRLYRENIDDRGFYRMQLHPLENSFVINYEGGVARVDDSGQVVWHRKMAWDDVFVRVEGTMLVFRNVSNTTDFHVSIATGSTQRA